jgi:hypothetical protein
MKQALYQAPTAAELYALERRARQERARFIAGLLRSAFDRASSALEFDRASSALTTEKVVRHA